MPGPPPPPPVILKTIVVSPDKLSLEPGFSSQLTATGSYSDGSTKDVTNSASWSSSNAAIAAVSSGGSVSPKSVGVTTVEAASGSVSGSANVTVIPVGHFVKNTGLYTQFERRGWLSEFWSGEVIQNWNQFDSLVGSTVSQEVSLQLDKMKAMGVNTITFELRTADPTVTAIFQPPDCNLNQATGFQFPQPTATELANAPVFFDMVQSKGMKVWLRLVNTHMEQQPPTNSQTWLGAILGAIGRHPALDLILFEGNSHLVTVNGSPACGIPAEPPLWLGPGSVPANYIQWAIRFAISQGVLPQKLSAEAIVGDYFLENSPPAGSDAATPLR